MGRPVWFAGDQAPGGLSTTQAWTGGKFLLSSLERAFSVQLFSIGVSKFQAAKTCVASHFPDELSLGWSFGIVLEKKSMFLERLFLCWFLPEGFACHLHRGSSRSAVFVYIPDSKRSWKTCILKKLFGDFNIFRIFGLI